MNLKNTLIPFDDIYDRLNSDYYIETAKQLLYKVQMYINFQNSKKSFSSRGRKISIEWPF